jgi:23S rRNA (uracil1939-C5)-methyltransferase
MLHGGECLARAAAGDTILVDAALPDELVEAEVTGRRAGVTRARVLQVLEPSPDRIEPPCRYVGACGGCDLQHVAYPRQLQLKREVVRDAMRRQAVTLPAETTVHGMEDPWRYRRRGEFHVVRDREQPGRPIVGLGFNRVRSWRPVAVDDCLIHAAAITTALPALLEAARRGGDGRLNLLHLTAGGDGAELLVAPKPPRALDPAALDAAALAVGEGRARWAVEATTLGWRGHQYRVTPRSFIQVNQAQMDVLYQCVLDGLGDITGARVVDAYAGIGVLSVELAARVGEGGAVVCVEEVPGAARLGMLNAQLNGVEGRMRYDARRVEVALPELAAAAPIDALVVDPPRAGCASSVTGWLALRGPARVAYISCDPATLARDLHILVASGPYAVKRLDLVDMFPQTHHIECVALLQRQ